MKLAIIALALGAAHAARHRVTPNALCTCGHTLEDHHQSWYRGGAHSATECEHYGSNETGALMPAHADGSICEDWRCELEHTWLNHCDHFTPA